jgi:hypothetical protein
MNEFFPLGTRARTTFIFSSGLEAAFFFFTRNRSQNCIHIFIRTRSRILFFFTRNQSRKSGTKMMQLRHIAFLFIREFCKQRPDLRRNPPPPLSPREALFGQTSSLKRLMMKGGVGYPPRDFITTFGISLIIHYTLPKI